MFRCVFVSEEMDEGKQTNYNNKNTTENAIISAGFARPNELGLALETHLTPLNCVQFPWER